MRSKPLVMLVGDVVPERGKALSTRSFDADKPTIQDVEQITSWLVAAGYAVQTRESVTSFTANPPSISPMFSSFRCGAEALLETERPSSQPFVSDLDQRSSQLDTISAEQA